MFLHNIPQELIKPFLDMAYTMIKANGIVSQEEGEAINYYALELHVDTLPKCSIVDYDETLDQFMSLSDTVKKEIFFELLAMAYSDLIISDRENELISIAQRKFGISDELRKQLADVLTGLVEGYRKLGTILNQ